MGLTCHILQGSDSPLPVTPIQINTCPQPMFQPYAHFLATCCYMLHATCMYMQSWIHSAGGHLQLISEGPYARDTRTRGVARSHTIFRAEGVQPCFGDGSLTIREHYALADANVALYKFPSWRLPAHPALLLSPFFLLQMP